jgi:hypothetical protein
MLGEPEALKSPAFAMPGEVERMAQRIGRGAATRDEGEIENR